MGYVLAFLAGVMVHGVLVLAAEIRAGRRPAPAPPPRRPSGGKRWVCHRPDPPEAPDPWEGIEQW